VIIKFSSTEDFKCDVIPAEIITDPKQLTKRAGSERFKHIKIPKHQTPVHLVALGSYEGTGANRNLDLFYEDDCLRKHSTFVKAGRAVHIQHKNKPADPKFGNIYDSDYNEKMKRIELMIGIDTNAPRMAKSLQKLAQGKQVSYSMASRQAWDRCTLCKHKSYDGKTDRCEHIPRRLGEITKEGVMIAMENIDPTWFEISDVDSTRGADRIAFSLNKTASEHNDVQERYTNNLKLAEEIYLPPALTLSKYASEKRTLLNKLSKIEKHIDAVAQGKVHDSRDKYIKDEAAKLNNAAQLSDKTIEELREFTDHKKLLKALADKGIIFTPEEFYKYIFNNHDVSNVEDMKSHLPSVFNNLQDEDLHDEDFQPEEGKIPQSIMELVKSLTSDHSLFPGPASGRIMRITIIKSTPHELKKESSDKSESVLAKDIAMKYANYQLSALSYLEENGKLDDQTIINTLILNRR